MRHEYDMDNDPSHINDIRNLSKIVAKSLQMCLLSTLIFPLGFLKCYLIFIFLRYPNVIF